AVDPVGLRSPAALLHRYAPGIEHVVLDPIRLQKPMQPIPVVARLVAALHARQRPQLAARPLAHALEQRQQSGTVSHLDLVVGHPILVRTMKCHQPVLLAQFDCNENRAIMTRDGRAHVGCLHLASPMVRVCKPKPIGCTPIAPWNLRISTVMPKRPKKPAAVEDLTEKQAKAEYTRLQAEIAGHDRRYYQDDAPTVS